MYNCRFAVCAESVVIDISTNNVSIFNIVDAIAAVGFPIGINKLSAIFLLTREEVDPSTVDAIISVSMANEAISTHPYQIDFQGTLRNRCVVTAGGIVVPGPGILKFSLTINNAEIAAIDVAVSGPPPTLAAEAIPAPV